MTIFLYILFLLAWDPAVPWKHHHRCLSVTLRLLSLHSWTSALGFGQVSFYTFAMHKLIFQIPIFFKVCVIPLGAQPVWTPSEVQSVPVFMAYAGPCLSTLISMSAIPHDISIHREHLSALSVNQFPNSWSSLPLPHPLPCQILGNLISRTARASYPRITSLSSILILVPHFTSLHCHIQVRVILMLN